MYCNQCNCFNNDNSKFCNNCGAPLVNFSDNPPPQSNYSDGHVPPQNAGANGQPNFNYGMPYNTPYSRPQTVPSKAYTNVLPIVAIILSALSTNIIAIVLAVLAIVKFNEYDKGRFCGGNFITENAGKQSKNFAIAAIVVAALTMVLWIVYFVFMLLGFGFFGADLFYELFDEGDYYYYSNIFSLFI